MFSRMSSAACGEISTTNELSEKDLPEVGLVLVLSVGAVLQGGNCRVVGGDQTQAVGHADGGMSCQEGEGVSESVGSVGQRVGGQRSAWRLDRTRARVVVGRGKRSFTLPTVGMQLLLFICHNLNKSMILLLRLNFLPSNIP